MGKLHHQPARPIPSNLKVWSRTMVRGSDPLSPRSGPEPARRTATPRSRMISQTSALWWTRPTRGNSGICGARQTQKPSAAGLRANLVSQKSGNSIERYGFLNRTYNRSIWRRSERLMQPASGTAERNGLRIRFRKAAGTAAPRSEWSLEEEKYCLVRSEACGWSG